MKRGHSILKHIKSITNIIQEWDETEFIASADSNKPIMLVSAYILVCRNNGTINSRDSPFKSHCAHHKPYMKQPEIKPESSMPRNNQFLSD